MKHQYTITVFNNDTLTISSYVIQADSADKAVMIVKTDMLTKPYLSLPLLGDYPIVVRAASTVVDAWGNIVTDSEKRIIR